MLTGGSRITPCLVVITISLADVTEGQLLAGAYPERIREIVREVAGDAEVWITGGPVVKTATTRALLDTLTFTIPLIFGLMAVVLTLAFRSARAVLVCMVTVAIALLWTVATVSALGLTLNLVTAIVPPMVLTLGLTYTIHVLSDYLKHEPGTPAARSAADRAMATMSHIAVPIGLSFVTTVIGFLGFLPSPLPAIRQFGILAMAGIGYAAVLALVLIPALLSVTGSRER